MCFDYVERILVYIIFEFYLCFIGRGSRFRLLMSGIDK